jgi:hypothetical protein
MRAVKILTVTMVMTASVVLGVAGTASAAPAPKAQPSTLWCC